MTNGQTWNTTVYEDLYQMARRLMATEGKDHTLQPTALTNELWLRLLGSRNVDALDYPAFLGLASQAMRRILTDHARRRSALKRGAQVQRTTCADKQRELEPEDFAIDLDAALVALGKVDAELVRIVELRFYVGLPLEEVAEQLDRSVRTIKRRWCFARAWLQQHIQEELK